MEENEREARALYDRGMESMWAGELECAISDFDRARDLVQDEVFGELITIRKAEALIAMDEEGPEVAALPGIVLRRRHPRNVYHAASGLMRKFTECADDRKRAAFYAEVALRAAEELEDPLPRVKALNGIGVVHVVESRFSQAIEVFDQALAIIALADGANDEFQRMKPVVLGNIGCAKVMNGETVDGIRILESVLPEFSAPYLVAEVCLDLCFGYIERGDYAVAESYGRRGLELAQIGRQTRNANHLLGEICVRTDRYEEADGYFDVVAAYYPQFKNVKQLLVAVDLFSVINWKA